MMEAAIGLLQHGFEVGEAGIADEIGAHHPEGGIGIVEPGEPGDRLGLESRGQASGI